MGRFAGLAMCPAEAKLLFCNSFPQFVGQFSGSVVQLLLWVSFDPHTDGEEKIGIISFQEFFSLPSQWLSARCQGREVFGKQMWLIPVSWAAPPSALHKTLYNDFTQCSVRGEGVRCSALLQCSLWPIVCIRVHVVESPNQTVGGPDLPTLPHTHLNIVIPVIPVVFVFVFVFPKVSQHFQSSLSLAACTPPLQSALIFITPCPLKSKPIFCPKAS